MLNFCAVALALNDLGYRSVGIRIDSGDLAYLSRFNNFIFIKCWIYNLAISSSMKNNPEFLALTTMNDKLKYIPNNDKQNYPFFGQNLLIERFELW